LPVVTIFKGAKSLVSKYDPARLSGDDTGLRELARAVNVIIEPRYRVSRRWGATESASGNCHSLFTVGSWGLIVKDDYLNLIRPGLGMTQLRAVTIDDHMSYVNFRGKIYYTNGVENGYVENDSDHAWSVDTPGRHETDAGRVYSSTVPLGHLLETFNGRLLIAQDNIVWVGKRGFAGLYRPLNILRFSNKIKLLQSVQNGFFVGDESGIYWIGGTKPKEFVMTKVADYAPKTGATMKIPGDYLAINPGYEGLNGTGLIPIFDTVEGACIGGPGGFFRNLIQDKIETQKYPWPFQAQRGAAGLINQYLVITNEV
jgi:hypothetical protein